MDAKKRFGQHFLHDPAIGRAIVHLAGVAKGDAVLEIGPGHGALTQPLVEAGVRLTAFELDRDLLSGLQERFPSVEVRGQDAVDVDWPSILPGSGWHVVANLPYNVATPIVAQLLAHPGTFRRLTVMVQREVADRIVAPPGSRIANRLGLYVDLRATSQVVMTLAPGAFRPPPKVHSAVVRLDLRPEPLGGEGVATRVETVARWGYGARRKTLRNALRGVWDAEHVDAWLSQADVDGGQRAEALDRDAWLRLGRTMPADAPAR